jgi:integrase
LVRKINRLTARTVATLTKPGRHADGAGLYLKIDRSGAKRWVFMYERGGKQREAGLGPVNAVALVKARELAASFRVVLAEGADPIKTRKAERAAQDSRRTFGQMAEGFLAAQEHGWRNAKHRQQWRNTLATYAAPLWSMHVDEIGTEDVLQALQPIWQTKPETASRVRGRIEAVLDAARVQRLRQGENPARWRGHLDKLLPKAKKLSRGHHAAMPYAGAPAFLARLRERESMAAMALEFLILTAARSGEVLGARWAEIDLVAKVWTVPGDRMKAGRQHRVPLSPPTLEIIERLAEGKIGEFIFPGQRPGRPLSGMALEMVLRRMKAGGVTVHGFRSSFRDWSGDCTSFPREICEAALAHVAGDMTERAYRRSDALEQRRELMSAWARYLANNAQPNIITIDGRRVKECG